MLYFVKYIQNGMMKPPMKIACPITEVAELLSDTWTMLIMHQLILGPKKFCEVERALSGISTRTLTNKLKRLSEVELLLKTEEGLYMATEKGNGLRIVENAMKRYQGQYL
jgi:DNA-binding HxlR family transcriptional regulator